MLKDKLAAVTGAGSGLGRGIAVRFAAEGATVVALDNNLAAAEATVADLDGNDRAHRAIGLDVSSPAAVTDVFDGLADLDVLVNCAGIREIREPLVLPAEEWDRVIAVNLSGTFYCAQAAARAMVARGAGSIINISSITGLTGFSMRPAYSASKAGVLGLTRSLSQDLAGHGVRVNAICPGLIGTAMTQAYLEDEDFVERIGMTIPMARAGDPDDVAQAALYLAGDMSSFVTGTALTVDGGFMAAGTFDPTAQGSAFTADNTLPG